MSKRAVSIFIFLCLVLCLQGRGLIGPAQVPEVKTQQNTNPSGLKVDFGSIPLYFTANRGQVDSRALFYAKASRYTLWLTEEGLVFDSFKSESPEAPAIGKEPSLRPEKLEGRKYERDISRLVFLNAAKHPEIVPVDETALKVNYFIGNDPAKWHTAVPTSEAVLYKNIYDRIDLKVYGIESRIEYDWIIRSGGNPRDIRFKYENVKGTRVDEAGNLLVETGFGELMHKKPVAYQEGVDGRPVKGRAFAAEAAPLTEAGATAALVGPSENATRTSVESAFKNIGENSYGFEVGAYNTGRELVIDPVVLAYSTYLGGSGADEGRGIAVDSRGNAYVTGYTASTNFPTLNQYQTDQADVDVFVTEIDTSQSGNASLVYSTYLGGNSYDYGYGIAVDGSSNAYVTGYTNSTNFPTLNQYQTDQTYSDVFVTKLDTTQSGNASLVYSTYLGGNSHDFGFGIAVDGSGDAYVTGQTYSTDFPILNQYQTDQTSADVFVTKIDTTQSGNASLVYSTYLGGNSEYEYGYGIAADNSGNAYLTGATVSTNFPTLNQYQTDQTSWDVFVTKLDTTQSGNASLVYSTYLGGNQNEQGYGIAVDNSGKAYVTGWTDSLNFPILNQYQSRQTYYDAFVTKLDTTQSGNASLVYSTYLGGNNNDIGRGIAVDGSGNAYITGYTLSTNFPILKQYQTDQTSWDMFVTKLDTTQSGNAGLVYSTYLGGSGQDGYYYSNDYAGIAVDGRGNAYVTGYTDSTDFPTLNQYQMDQGGRDVYITKIRASADISVTKTSDNLTPKVGETFNFTVTAANNGPMGATGLQVTDSLPAGLAYQSSTLSKGTYTSGTGIWDIGALAIGETATLTLSVVGTAGGGATNTASVSALNEYDPDTSNDSASVTVSLKYVLRIRAGTGGTTDPEPGTYSYDPGASVSILATASAGYRFGYWSGDASGSVDKGTSVGISAAASAGDRIGSRSGGASGSANPITITMNGNKIVTANFIRGYELIISAGAGGTTVPEPGTYFHDGGTSVKVQANPSTGYQFDSWTGDASGSANPLTVVMDRDKTIQANFSGVVKPPLGLTGEKLVNRNVSTVEYVVRLKWQPNGANTEPISYRIYRIENSQATLVGSVGAGTYEYIVRRLLATRAYRFGVTAVNSQGWESDRVEVAVQ
jgi:uncharacterized repeat protein (TIGR01451 family)